MAQLFLKLWQIYRKFKTAADGVCCETCLTAHTVTPHPLIGNMLKLPPLPALRSFEAVSRLGSVTRAAQELHVTHSAVSHQLKLLESHLGIALIDRSTRRMVLTSDGRAYAYQVRQALSQVASATRRIAMRTQAEHLTVAVLPSFATHWLIPRLAGFYALHPDWTIELMASLEMVDFDESPADCAIRFGNVESSGAHSEWLMSEQQLLVAAPDDERFSPTQTPSETLAVNRFITANESWSHWSLAAGLDVPPPSPSFIVNDSNLALEAARSGLGATLTRLSIAELWLRQGWLRPVTRIIAAHTASYHMVWPNRSHQSDKLMIFTDWLKDQCRLYEHSIAQSIYPLATARAFNFLKSDKLRLPLEHS